MSLVWQAEAVSSDEVVPIRHLDSGYCCDIRIGIWPGVGNLFEFVIKL